MVLRQRAVCYLAGSLLTALSLLGLVTPVANAEGGEVTVTEVKVDGYPNVTVRFVATAADGLPLAGLSEVEVRVYENGVDQGPLSVHPLAQAQVPLGVMLAIDTSGSMKGEPLAKAKLAARTFVSELRPVDRMGLIRFSTEASVDVRLPADEEDLDADALMEGIDQLIAEGDTKLYDAVHLAVSEAGKIEGNRVAVVLTDGRDTKSSKELEQAIELAVEEKVPVYAIGLGSNVDAPLLQQLAARTGGRYYNAPAPQELAYVFKLLSKQLQNQYEVSYASATDASAGSPVAVRLAVSRPDGQDLGAEASYSMPMVIRPEDKEKDYGIRKIIPGLARPKKKAPQEEKKVEGQALRVVEGTQGPFSDEQIDLLGRIAAGMAFFGGVFFFGGWVRQRERRRTLERLENYVRGQAVRIPERKPSLPERAVGPLGMLLGRLVMRFLPSKMAAQWRHNLMLAGRPFGWRLEHLLAAKVVLGVMLGAASFVALLGRNSARAVLMALVATALGFYLPHIWLGMLIRSRQSRILKALPDALDLLTISVEAGIGFDGAVLEVCQKWENPLTTEFATALQEIRIGRGRRDALRDMAARTGVPEVSTFVSAVIQANELGVDIAQTLNAQAQQMRVRRRQRAEELAHKASVKMLFPMGFLIFPALFIIILGPAIPSLRMFAEAVK